MSELVRGSFEGFLGGTERDLLAELLADKRSMNTRRAYEADLRDFFGVVTGQMPTPKLIAEFLTLERFAAIALVLKYKAHLIEKRLAEATVNRRLAAIKSLVRYAQRVGKCEWSLEEIQGEKVQTYRDTSGVDQQTYRKILATCNCATLPGKRDYAILHLLWSNVLRRNEVHLLNVSDLDPESGRLQILGKGRGTQAEWVDLSPATVQAIQTWLKARNNLNLNAPLFIALDPVTWGHRLSGNSIYELVKDAAQKAGVKKRFSPHRVRHSGITAALDATDGDVRRVQKLSRHRSLQTVLIYDDARKNLQGEITNLLSDALTDARTPDQSE